MLFESKLKKKMQHKKPILRSFLRFPDPSVAEIMALAGVEMITIDQEHYPFDDEEIEKVVRAAQCFGSEVLVRVPCIDTEHIGSILESGCTGIVVPHVETYEEALEVVRAVKYSPIGNRGFCPITRAAFYGMRMSPAEYAAYANTQTIIILMTETKKGLENLDRILTIPEVDGIAIGPSDVSASYGYPGHPENPVVKAAIEKAQSQIATSGKCLCAQAYTIEMAQKVLAKGATVLNVGSDVQLLDSSFTNLIDSITKITTK